MGRSTPRCKNCGKKFKTLTDLENHHRSVHQGQKFVAPKINPTRNFAIAVILVIVIVGAIVGYLIYNQSEQQPPMTFTNTGSLSVCSVS